MESEEDVCKNCFETLEKENPSIERVNIFSSTYLEYLIQHFVLFHNVLQNYSLTSIQGG